MAKYRIPDHHKDLFRGPGMRLALWQQPNHCDHWTPEDDEAALARTSRNAKQYPDFVARMNKDIAENQRPLGS